VRDDAGALVSPSDPRLGELWDTAGELGVPVLIHTADPPAFFEPVDIRNERLEELVIHPEWSYASPRFPHFAELMHALDATVAAHPGTTFIAAHVGCYAENLQWVSDALDRHPNLFVDIAGRISELGRQPRAAARLVLQHRDRVLFGTDVFPPDGENYAIYFRFLESADEDFPYAPTPVPRQGRWRISGIELPNDVLRSVYRDNAFRILEPGPTLSARADVATDQRLAGLGSAGPDAR
jgi:predicted TIM-barrel fold metal-dependent hydrolase